MLSALRVGPNRPGSPPKKGPKLDLKAAIAKEISASSEFKKEARSWLIKNMPEQAFAESEEDLVTEIAQAMTMDNEQLTAECPPGVVRVV